MPRVRSVVVSTLFSSGLKKLGHPVPLSNLVSAENSGCPQPAHANIPSRFSTLCGLEPGGSVPCSRRTLYCWGVSVSRHSESVFCAIFDTVSSRRQTLPFDALVGFARSDILELF